MTTHDDERLRRPARLRSLQLPDATVTYLPDGVVQLHPHAWLPGAGDVWAQHPEYLDAAGDLVASIGALLVERGDRAMLVDAGFGPLAEPAQPGMPHGAIRGGDLLESLAAVGRRPEDIDTVAVTHLHPDHIGWLWQPAPGHDRPPFAHSDVVLAGPEWAQRGLAAAAHPMGAEIIAAMAPMVRTVADGEEIFPGVRALFTAGHTAGHAAYVLTSGGQRLIAFGDALHTPIQVDHPEWSAAPDHDPGQSADARRRLVRELAEPATLGFGVHFADVVFGRVRRDGPGPAWEPVTG